MVREPHDVVILGSGPAGYVAGIRAAQLGLSACIVEKDRLGGVCLNLGCIPSKALIHQAEVFASSAELEAMGVAVDRSRLSYRKVFDASRAVAERMSRGVKHLLEKNGVRVVQGTGTIAERGRSVSPMAPRSGAGTSSWPPAPGRASCPASSSTARP